MKNLAYILVVGAIITLVLSLLSKFSSQMIGGIGQRGYLGATALLLLFGANIALLELLGKK